MAVGSDDGPRHPNAAPTPIIHLTPEYYPFAQVGGLARSVAGLAHAQAIRGILTYALVPLYRQVRASGLSLRPVGAPYAIRVGPDEEQAQLFERPLETGENGVRVLFVSGDLFDRPGIYGDDGTDYPDNAHRFAFFCLAALKALPVLFGAPVILHAHDRHTALALVYLRTLYRGQAYFDRIATVLTVRNASSGGRFPFDLFGDIEASASPHAGEAVAWVNEVNWAASALAFADAVTSANGGRLRGQDASPDGAIERLREVYERALDARRDGLAGS